MPHLVVQLHVYWLSAEHWYNLKRLTWIKCLPTALKSSRASAVLTYRGAGSRGQPRPPYVGTAKQSATSTSTRDLQATSPGASYVRGHLSEFRSDKSKPVGSGYTCALAPVETDALRRWCLGFANPDIYPISALSP